MSLIPAGGPRDRLERVLGWVVLALAAPAQGELALELVPVADALARPLALTHAGDGSGRLFIAEQEGRILVVDASGVLEQPFLDIQGLVTCCGERGLLGLAFHPDYAAEGLFFVAYTDLAGDLVVARYSVSAEDSNQADPASATPLLTVAQPFGNHNGCHLAFGPDGYLYIGVGDGGSGGDPQNNAQDLTTRLGKMLRIDVDNPDEGLEYGVPADNPFVGDPGVPGEIWAYGFRNPWRFAFDRGTGDLWIGDVGQQAVEEIDFQPAASAGGENYGWRRMEGSACFNPPVGCDDGTLTLPVMEYSHAEGCSVTGGYRYRGALFPRLGGVYVFGDFCSGIVWGTEPRCDSSWVRRPLLASGLSLSSFGEDEQGEIYAVDLGGAVYRLGLDPSSGGAVVGSSPPDLQFGAVPVATLETLELEIRNNNFGEEAALVSALTLSGPAAFALDVGGGRFPCGSLSPCLAPGELCTVGVEFFAADAGSYSGVLSIEGNFEPLDVSLEAVAYASCPHPVDLVLENIEISDPQTYVACGTIGTGPGFLVTATGSASLTAGQAVILGEGTTVAAGGELVVAYDPTVALP